MGQTISRPTPVANHNSNGTHYGVRNLLYTETSLYNLGYGDSRRRGQLQVATSIIDAVKSDDYETVLVTLDSLDDSDSQYDVNTIREEIVTYRDELIKDGWNVFHFAAYHQSDSITEKLVEFIGDVECINEKSRGGYTPLHLAVRGDWDNERLVQALLEHPRLNLDAQDKEKWTPLHHACHRGFAKSVRALHRAEFCVVNNEGDSPLHIAATNQYTSIFAILSECVGFRQRYTSNSCFTQMKDEEGNTLLHLAVDASNRTITEWCLAFGFSAFTCNNRRMNCMHFAARKGDIDIAHSILQRAQWENAENITSFVNAPGHDRSTPFYMAAKFGNLQIMELLLENGANIDAKTAFHFTPLLSAIRYSQSGPVSMLLRRGANMMVKDSLKHYNPIMWAVEIQNQEILKCLLEHVSQGEHEDVWREVDLEHNTAHHIAARAKNADILKTLMEYNVSCLAKKNSNGQTPFHIAIQQGKLSILNFIISNYINVTYILDNNGSSGLHLAAGAGHTDIADRLLRVRSSDNTISTCNDSGWTPIHLAAKNGHLETLQLLVQHANRRHIDIIDNKHQTALYLACCKGRPKCAEFLIKQGAMVTYRCKQNGGEIEMSCLNAAIDADHNSVVATILHSDKWQQALQYCHFVDTAIKHHSSFLPKLLKFLPGVAIPLKHPETPLRKLIKKMPEEARIAFDNCYTREKKFVEEERGGKYYTEEIHYNYDYIEDFQDLYIDQGSKVLSDGDEAIPFETSVRRRVSAVNLRGGNQPANGDGWFVPGGERVEYLEHQEPTALPRVTERWGPEKYHYEHHPLHLMVLYKREELLKHDLVASFIHYKWNLFGRWVYYPNVAIYTLLMLLLTIYMYLRFDYSKLISDTYEAQTNVSLSPTDCSLNTTLLSMKAEYTDARLERDRKSLIVCSVFIILICLVRIGMEFYQMVYHALDYFLNFVNYMELVLYIATIIFVIDFEFHCLKSWQWQLGSLCIFLSWIDFIIFLSEQPAVGIYVVMFQHMFKTFLKLTPMALLLVFAFGQPFFMLLSLVEIETPPQQFVTFPYSLLKTFSMITGELEIDRIFFATPSVVTYPVATYLLWVMFLIIMPLLLQNMLVGLAVDDIKSVLEKAALKKEALQIAFILDIVHQMPKFMVKKWNGRRYTQSWGKSPLEKFWKWLNGSYWKREFKCETIKSDGVAGGIKTEDVCRTVTNMEKRLQLQLNETNDKLEKLTLLLTQKHAISLHSPSPHTLNPQLNTDPTVV